MNSDYYEIAGISSQLPVKEIKNQVSQLEEESSPALLKKQNDDPEDAGFKKKLGEWLRRSAALSILQDESRRQSYDRRRADLSRLDDQVSKAEKKASKKKKETQEEEHLTQLRISAEEIRSRLEEALFLMLHRKAREAEEVFAGSNLAGAARNYVIGERIRRIVDHIGGDDGEGEEDAQIEGWRKRMRMLSEGSAQPELAGDGQEPSDKIEDTNELRYILTAQSATMGDVAAVTRIYDTERFQIVDYWNSLVDQRIRGTDEYERIYESIKGRDLSVLRKEIIERTGITALKSLKYTSARKAFEELNLSAGYSDLLCDSAYEALAAGDFEPAAKYLIWLAGLKSKPAVLFQYTGPAIHHQCPELGENCPVKSARPQFIELALQYVFGMDDFPCPLWVFSEKEKELLLQQFIRFRDPAWKEYLESWEQAQKATEENEASKSESELQEEAEDEREESDTFSENSDEEEKEKPLEKFQDFLLNKRLEPEDGRMYLSMLSWEHPITPLTVCLEETDNITVELKPVESGAKFIESIMALNE